MKSRMLLAALLAPFVATAGLVGAQAPSERPRVVKPSEATAKMKISAETAEHYVWGEVCDGWHLVKQPSLSVIRERMPPGAAEVNHLHEHARQFFFVLSGVATLDVDGKPVELKVGEGVEIAPGVPHQMRNRSSSDVEFLVVSQPPSHGDRKTV